MSRVIAFALLVSPLSAVAFVGTFTLVGLAMELLLKVDPHYFFIAWFALLAVSVRSALSKLKERQTT